MPGWAKRGGPIRTPDRFKRDGGPVASGPPSGPERAPGRLEDRGLGRGWRLVRGRSAGALPPRATAMPAARSGSRRRAAAC
ncbi:hypothetical protein LG3211_4157 [Lysobacter gummosus]|nr:hypothetical protein LG3211_4157 [Lysobacter gummosus]